MRIQIIARNVRCGRQVEEHIRRRAHFALARFQSLFRGLQVHLADENGPRGGADKRCRAIAMLQRGNPLVVESRGAELSDLIDQTIQRLGRALARAARRKFERFDMGRNLWPAAEG